MSKHTKGPWVATSQGGVWTRDEVNGKQSSRVQVVMSDGIRGNPYSDAYEEECKANIDLIADAPGFPHYCTDPECKGGKLMRDLEHLTPGGSEFVGDVERCIEAIKQSREMESKVRETLARKLKSERELNAELLESLKAAQRVLEDQTREVCGNGSLTGCEEFYKGYNVVVRREILRASSVLGTVNAAIAEAEGKPAAVKEGRKP